MGYTIEISCLGVDQSEPIEESHSRRSLGKHGERKSRPFSFPLKDRIPDFKGAEAAA